MSKTAEESADRIAKVLATFNRETANAKLGLFCEEKINGIGIYTQTQSIEPCMDKLTQVYNEFVKPVLKLREM